MIRLTGEQVIAAAAIDHVVNIVSAPGSGKTTVAAERFGFLRFQRGDERGVLGLTFNRAAANEFGTRVASRWGASSTTFPHRISTFDHLYVDLLHILLRSGSISWPEGHQSVDVRDEYGGFDGFVYLLPTQHYLRVAGLNNTDTVVSRSRAITEATRGVGSAAKHLSILRQGIVSHEDVRWILRAALEREALREMIVSWVAANYRAIIVDEVYDGDGLDLTIISLAADAGVHATVIGDPWQAMYRWRGATPELVAQLVHSTEETFVEYPLSISFRFRGEQMPGLAADLRDGLPVSLPSVGSEEVDVALARRWADLWQVGDNILPLAFRNVENATDAAICLLLDTVTRSRFGERAHGRESAITKLKLDREVFDARQTEVMQPLLDDLVGGAEPETVLDALREAVKSLGARRPSRLSVEKEALIALQLRQIGLRLVRRKLIPGLTVFQAKGREWDRVGVVLSTGQRTALAEGLRSDHEEHCITYVAVTRARKLCGRLEKIPELDLAGVEAVSTSSESDQSNGD